MMSSRRRAPARRVMLRIAAIAASVIAAGCLRPPDNPPGRALPPLRAMTWNIAAGHGNLSAIADGIRTVGADIVALQEVDVRWSERSRFEDQAAWLGRALAMHARFAPIYRLPGTGAAVREFGLAILSRHPIVEFRNYALPRLSTQSDDPEPRPMPGFPMAVVQAGGARLRVFSTHLDYRGDPRVRALQVAAMLAILQESAGPVLLMGDLNAPPTAAELAPLFSRLDDAWPSVGDPGFTYPADVPVRRIDYILSSGGLVFRDVRVPPFESSDHRPVVAEVSGVR